MVLAGRPKTKPTGKASLLGGQKGENPKAVRVRARAVNWRAGGAARLPSHPHKGGERPRHAVTSHHSPQVTVESKHCLQSVAADRSNRGNPSVGAGFQPGPLAFRPEASVCAPRRARHAFRALPPTDSQRSQGNSKAL